MSFAAARARLSGLVRGSFRGVEVIRRGVSPRIVSALVLGSRGTTRVSGPELATRLGLASTWAYFSVLSGAGLRREPDRSGRAPSAGHPAAPGEPRVAPEKQGGAAPMPAPVSAQSASAAGGVAAG
jgi:stage II sporulation protein D